MEYRMDKNGNIWDKLELETLKDVFTIQDWEEMTVIETNPRDREELQEKMRYIYRDYSPTSIIDLLREQQIKYNIAMCNTNIYDNLSKEKV